MEFLGPDQLNNHISYFRPALSEALSDATQPLEPVKR